MGEIESTVLAEYLEQLKVSKDVPSAVVEKLGTALTQEKLPKPEDLAALYRNESGDPVT